LSEGVHNKWRIKDTLPGCREGDGWFHPCATNIFRGAALSGVDVQMLPSKSQCSLNLSAPPTPARTSKSQARHKHLHVYSLMNYKLEFEVLSHLNLLSSFLSLNAIYLTMDFETELAFVVNSLRSL
jgi:hypothetical protein